MLVFFSFYLLLFYFSDHGNWVIKFFSVEERIKGSYSDKSLGLR